MNPWKNMFFLKPSFSGSIFRIRTVDIRLIFVLIVVDYDSSRLYWHRETSELWRLSLSQNVCIIFLEIYPYTQHIYIIWHFMSYAPFLMQLFFLVGHYKWTNESPGCPKRPCATWPNLWRRSWRWKDSPSKASWENPLDLNLRRLGCTVCTVQGCMLLFSVHYDFQTILVGVDTSMK